MAMAIPETSKMDGAAAGRLERVLNMQRAVMGQYGDSLEQLLSVLVYMIPVQDEDDGAGFWSQAVYSVLDLFSLYRSALLRNPNALPVVAAPNPTVGLSGQLQRSRVQYSIAAFLLRALRSVQVLLEMHAVRRSSASGLHGALRTCLRIEITKLVLKLVMWSRTPFSFYIDEDALESVEPPFRRAGPGAGPALPWGAASQGGGAFVGRRSGKTLLFGGGLARDRSAATLQIVAAEVLFHGRPLLHLLVLLRQGRRSWAAWLLALFLDSASLAMLLSNVQHKPDSRAAALESAELRRRRDLLWWVLARSPLYDRLFQRPCKALDNLLKRIPVLNIFNLVELCIALQPYYFTTSAS